MTTENQGTTTGAAGQPLDGGAGQASGSPSPSQEPSAQNDGSSSDGDQSGSALQTQVKELRQKLTAMGEDNKRYANVLTRASQTPEWGAVKDRLNGKDPGDAKVRQQKVDALIKEIAPGEAGSKLKELLSIYGKSVRADVLSEVGPSLRATRQVVHDAEFLKGIRESGLDPEVADNSDFQAHVQEVEADNPWLSSIPSTARGKYLADGFKHQNGKADQWSAENRRVQRARAGTMDDRAGASGAQAARAAGAVELPADADMLAVFQALDKAGGDESKLVFTKPAS